MRRFAKVSFRRKCLSFRFVCNRNDGRFLYHYGRRPKMQLSMFAKKNIVWDEAFHGNGMVGSAWDIARNDNGEKANSGHIRDPYCIC